MTSNSRQWLVPLTGLGFIAVGILSFIIGGEPKSADDPAREVVSWYVDNKDSVEVAAILSVVAGVLLVFFGAYLRDVLRAAGPGTRGPLVGRVHGIRGGRGRRGHRRNDHVRGRPRRPRTSPRRPCWRSRPCGTTTSSLFILGVELFLLGHWARRGEDRRPAEAARLGDDRARGRRLHADRLRRGHRLGAARADPEHLAVSLRARGPAVPAAQQAGQSPTRQIRRVGDLQIVIAALFISAAGRTRSPTGSAVPDPIPLVIGGLAGPYPRVSRTSSSTPSWSCSSSCRRCSTPRPSSRTSGRLRYGRARDLPAGDRAGPRHDGRRGRHRPRAIGLPWAMAFALGAIVSPTDPAAATAIMRRVGAPRRLVNILEGESLFNDATALVAYKVAVAAAVGASSAGGRGAGVLPRRRGHRDRSPGRVRDRGGQEARPRREHRADDLAVQRVRSVHTRRPAGAVGRPGRGHVRRLPRLARAGDRLAGEPHAGVRDVDDSHVPAQRGPVHPHRAPAAGDRRRPQRPARRAR